MHLHDQFSAERDRVLAIAQQVEGRLTLREMQFLFLLGAVKTAPGEVLEIGSFKGKSTVLLSHAASLAGDAKIYAVDPLTQPAETDPDTAATGTRGEFYANVRQYAQEVEFFEMTSQELAKQWNRPLRLLWIDGDHTFQGVRSDFQGFAGYLREGAIIAFHDVLNGFTGPLRVFAEDVLPDQKFGACGVVGSIAWAQRIGAQPNRYLREKQTLRSQLTGLLPHLVKAKRTRWDKLQFKLKRACIPHALPAAETWLGLLEPGD